MQQKIKASDKADRALEKPIIKLAEFLHIKPNIFTKYFLTFAAIFLTVLIVLGSVLMLLVNRYEIEENTSLLKSNVSSIASTIEDTLITQDMNTSYSFEKELLCETLATVSKSINADVFVCDTEGNIILCRDKAVGNILSSVYQQGSIVEKTKISGTKCFVVGTPIYSEGRIIGSVFALANAGVQSFSVTVFRIFLMCAFFCLIFDICQKYVCAHKTATRSS